MLNQSKEWAALVVALVVSFVIGCSSTPARERPVISVGEGGAIMAPHAASSGTEFRAVKVEVKHLDQGALVLPSFVGLEDGETPLLGIYKRKDDHRGARVVYRAPLDDGAKASLGLTTVQWVFLLYQDEVAGGFVHGNFLVYRRGSTLGVPHPRQSQIWAGIGNLHGGSVVDNDPDDGREWLGYCFLDCIQGGPERQAHLPHNAGAPATAPDKRRHRVTAPPAATASGAADSAGPVTAASVAATAVSPYRD